MKATFLFPAIFALLLSSCSTREATVVFSTGGREYSTLYEDSYFRLSNKEYHQEIALCSFASALSTVLADNEFGVKRYEHLFSLWEREGFHDCYANEDFDKDVGLDTASFAFAHKNIGDFDLVAITVNSGNIGAEWANSLTIGKEGNSKGYEESALSLLEELSVYVRQHSLIRHTKFWISGYSRGAGIANFAAGRMLEEIQSGTSELGSETTVKDVYAYCFEVPLTVKMTSFEAKGDLYAGIHNINNFNDPFTTLSPHDWGFVRYGQNHFYPDRLTDIHFDDKVREPLVSHYHFTPGAHLLPEYTIDDWKFFDPGANEDTEIDYPRETLHPSIGRFARNLVEAVSTGIVDRSLYAGYEPGLREFIGAAMGLNPEVKGFANGGGWLVEAIFSYPFVQTLFIELQERAFGGFIEDFELLLYTLFGANEENASTIKEIYSGMSGLMLFAAPSIVDNPDLLSQIFCRDNLLSISTPHNAELNYSFLRSCDRRIYRNTPCELNDGTYQVLHLHEPTFITIFDEGNRRGLFRYKDGTMESPCLSAEKRRSGDLDIYLPFNGQYTYLFEASSASLGKVDEYGEETIIFHDLANQGVI